MGKEFRNSKKKVSLFGACKCFLCVIFKILSQVVGKLKIIKQTFRKQKCYSNFKIFIKSIICT